MARTLLIVESPNKARKIQGFLGSAVTVRASVGHVCDLPEKDYGVDLTTLEERYEVRNARVVGELRALVRSGAYERVLLGTDPDREGEAIAWHLARELGLPAGAPQRVEFREITAAAVRAALARPRTVDAARVDAQRSRRVLDRVVGFDVSSEICWPAGASSAGRVQTPALHVLCEREREILAFRAETYWTLGVTYAEGFEAVVPDDPGRGARAAGREEGGEEGGETARGAPPESHDRATARRSRNRSSADAGESLPGGDDEAGAGAPAGDAGGGRLRARRFPSREEAERTRETASRHDHVVRRVDRRRTSRRPDPPYTTSTLQQDASRKLRLSAKQVADQAQALFEAGYITYHRTDSVRVSDEAAAEARAHIGRVHPDALPERPPVARGKAGAQDAHEAIRPTHLDEDDRPPAGAERLYALIKARFLASQCRPALFDRSTIWVDSGPVGWAAEGAVLVEPGFLRFWAPYARTEEVELPTVVPGQVLTPRGYDVREKQTTPPPRYDTGALIRKLELSGIGRPATFASIVETLLRRGYVVEVTTTDAAARPTGDGQEDGAATGRATGRATKGRKAAARPGGASSAGRGGKRVLQPTALGLQLDGLLTASFPALVSEEYTAGMEGELDRIERRDGETRSGYLRRWYADFRRAMGDALCEAAAYRARHGLAAHRRAVAAGGARGEETAVRCDRCGEATYRKLERRKGRGSFLACPACRHTRDVRARTRPGACPRCGSTLLERRGKKKGVKFWGCVRYGAAERPCEYAEFEDGPKGPGRGPRAAAREDGGDGSGGGPPETQDRTADAGERNPSPAGRTRRTPGARSAAPRKRASAEKSGRTPRKRAAGSAAASAASAATPAVAPAAPRPTAHGPQAAAVPSGKPCPRCLAASLDVVTAGDTAMYACPAGGCGFVLPVGARRRGAACPRCGGVVVERRGSAADVWACARAGCDYRMPTGRAPG